MCKSEKPVDQMTPEDGAESNGNELLFEDLSCSACGYRLTGLKPRGDCPECGSSIQKTIDSTPQQRDRLKSPLHVAYHGYLPTNECEEGFMILFDHNYSLKSEEISLLDVAPALLAMLNCDAPSQMVGRSQLG